MARHIGIGTGAAASSRYPLPSSPCEPTESCVCRNSQSQAPSRSHSQLTPAPTYRYSDTPTSARTEEVREREAFMHEALRDVTATANALSALDMAPLAMDTLDEVVLFISQTAPLLQLCMCGL
jgi:hypothetical protein